jgi:hypothetical protein
LSKAWLIVVKQSNVNLAGNGSISGFKDLQNRKSTAFLSLPVRDNETKAGKAKVTFAEKVDETDGQVSTLTNFFFRHIKN